MLLRTQSQHGEPFAHDIDRPPVRRCNGERLENRRLHGAGDLRSIRPAPSHRYALDGVAVDGGAQFRLRVGSRWFIAALTCPAVRVRKPTVRRW